LERERNGRGESGEEGKERPEVIERVRRAERGRWRGNKIDGLESRRRKEDGTTTHDGPEIQGVTHWDLN
jgi:hypothetical protein